MILCVLYIYICHANVVIVISVRGASSVKKLQCSFLLCHRWDLQSVVYVSDGSRPYIYHCRSPNMEVFTCWWRPINNQDNVTYTLQYSTGWDAPHIGWWFMQRSVTLVMHSKCGHVVSAGTALLRTVPITWAAASTAASSTPNTLRSGRCTAWKWRLTPARGRWPLRDTAWTWLI